MTEPWELVSRLRPKLTARAADYDRTGEFPVADFADLREAGLFGLLVPARAGGLGATYADYARVAFELARGNGATALVFNMHASVTGALAGVPDELARSLGVPESFFADRDRVLAFHGDSTFADWLGAVPPAVDSVLRPTLQRSSAEPETKAAKCARWR